MDVYIDAARNKIGLARRHLLMLDSFRAGEPGEREDIQLNFEGVLRNGESAADQLAEAVTLKLKLGVRNPSAHKVIQALTDSDVDPEPFTAHLRTWVTIPIVIDAHKRRRDAVHHHYEKRPYKALGTWLLEPQTVNGTPSPYDGPLDVHAYCAAYVNTLDLLEETARQLENG